MRTRSLALMMWWLAACTSAAKPPQDEARKDEPPARLAADKPADGAAAPANTAPLQVADAAPPAAETGCVCDDLKPVCLAQEKRCVQCTPASFGACRGATPTCGADNRCVAAP